MATISVNPSSFENVSLGSVTNAQNGYTAQNSTTYSSIKIPTGAAFGSHAYYYFDLSQISASAITSIQISFRVQLSAAGPTLGFALEGGNSSVVLVDDFKSYTPKTYTVDASALGDAILTNPRLKIYAIVGSTKAVRNLQFYGATLTIEYEEGRAFSGNQNFNGVWEEMDSVWECYNGVWTEIAEGYECINGVWQETN